MNRLHLILVAVFSMLLACAPEVSARVYNAETGRFSTRDRLGQVDGPNLYEYVRSRPIAMRDPTGLVAATSTCGANDMCAGPIGPWLRLRACLSAPNFYACYSCCNQQGGAYNSGCLDLCRQRFPWTVPVPGGTPAEQACKQACDRNPNDYGVQTCLGGQVIACVCVDNELTPLPSGDPGQEFRDALNRCVGLQESIIQSGGLDCTNKEDGEDPDQPPITDPAAYCAFARRKLEALQAYKQCIEAISCQPNDDPCLNQKQWEKQRADRGISGYRAVVRSCEQNGF
jgi:hypothetical protein